MIQERHSIVHYTDTVVCTPPKGTAMSAMHSRSAFPQSECPVPVHRGQGRKRMFVLRSAYPPAQSAHPLRRERHAVRLAGPELQCSMAESPVCFRSSVPPSGLAALHGAICPSDRVFQTVRARSLATAAGQDPRGRRRLTCPPTPQPVSCRRGEGSPAAPVPRSVMPELHLIKTLLLNELCGSAGHQSGYFSTEEMFPMRI